MPIKPVSGKIQSQDINDNLSYLDTGKRDNTVNNPIKMGELSQAVKEGMTGGGVAVVGRNSVDEINLKKDAVGPNNVSFINIGVNLYNIDVATEDYYINNTSGVLVAFVGHIVSDFIPVVSGTTYTLSNHRKMVFFDEKRYYLSGIDGTTDSYTFTAANDGYLRISYDTNGVNADKVQLVVGSTLPPYEPYKISVDTLSLTSKQNAEISTSIGGLEPQQTSFMKTEYSKNIFNKNDVFLDTFYQPYPETITLSDYFVTDSFIRLEANKSYTINLCRMWILLDANEKVLSSTNTGSNSATITFTTDRPSLLEIAGDMQNLGITQIEEGISVTEYVQYTEPAFNIPDLLFNQEQRDSLVIGDLTVTKNGESFNITSEFDDTQNISIETARDGSSNGGFNLLRTMVGASTIHDTGDDITPIRISGSTVGANHGWAFIYEITMSNHGKTTADLGSTWTDGTTTYTLLKIEGVILIFGCPYTGLPGEVIASRIAPVADLTHVSGATNISQVSIVTLNSGQLYPSTNNHKVKYVLDGKEVTVDGRYDGKELQVHENYNIMGYKSIIDFAQSNIGTSFANDGVEGIVNLTIIYSFTKGGKCLVSHSFKALKKVLISSCGFLQSAALSATGHTTKRFLPNIRPVSGYDFKNGVDLSTYTVSVVIKDVDLIDPTVPPNRHIDWLYDSIGTKKFGFTMGYIVDKTDSSNAKRLANSNGYWDLRDTKKSYPFVMDNGILPAGAYRTILGYRNYLSPDEQLTNYNVVDDKKETYIYIDAHTNTVAYSKELENSIGKSIEVVAGEGFELLSDVVDANGITFNIANGYGYAILKIS